MAGYKLIIRTDVKRGMGWHFWIRQPWMPANPITLSGKTHTPHTNYSVSSSLWDVSIFRHSSPPPTPHLHLLPNPAFYMQHTYTPDHHQVRQIHTLKSYKHTHTTRWTFPAGFALATGVVERSSLTVNHVIMERSDFKRNADVSSP